MNPIIKDFDRFFKAISYGVVIGGFFSLIASGGVGVFAGALFAAVIILAWFLEKTSWQISERVGTAIIFLAVPLFYLDWKYQISGLNTREMIAAGNLIRLILILTGIKLLQKKSDRDWIFIYLISFFEVLLASGLSISPLFLAFFVLYLLFAVCSIIALEVKKSARKVWEREVKNNPAALGSREDVSKISFSKLFLTAASLCLLTVFFAVPLFFAFPRVGGANFGSGSNNLTSVTGFSDSVRLGEIGILQQSDEVVLRGRIEKGDRNKIGYFRWRGIALDTFDNHNWRKSKTQYNESFFKTDKDFFLLDSASDAQHIVTQTIYLEPIDTSVLFGLSKPIAVQGNFQFLAKDSEGAITIPHYNSERTTYKVFSDTRTPSVEQLKKDNVPYTIQHQRYLQLPEKYDERISNLARDVIEKAKATNRYDQARAIENYLQTNFGYTLELKAGGDEPLADFLFNVKEGHCEYFATAMAIMLRTQGVATRVVNGFQQGEYNETADVYVVRQRDAHSWVEVYFPKENAWIPFDPTPSAGKFSENAGQNFAAKINKYAEALETFWIQYVVSYDNQEQKTLARSVRNSFADYQKKFSAWFNETKSNLSEWWKKARGDEGIEQSAKSIGYGILYLLAFISGLFFVVWLYRKFSKSRFWKTFRDWLKFKRETSIVEFYERMQKILARRGFRREPHQTPLEFAFALEMPEAVKITERYNRVRFGEKNLSKTEAEEIENWLESLEEISPQRHGDAEKINK
ncbi:MAG: transglutaminaseTgpA domain-containing protein [Pyrinomonadaceae bacterium]